MKKLLYWLMIWLVVFPALADTNIFKISDYPNTPTLSGTDLFLIAVPGITNRNIRWNQLQTFFDLSGTASSATNKVYSDGTNAAKSYTDARVVGATNVTIVPSRIATNAAAANKMLYATSATTTKWDDAPTGSGGVAGVTASGSATATTNGSGVVNIAVTGSGGDVTTAQLQSATNNMDASKLTVGTADPSRIATNTPSANQVLAATSASTAAWTDSTTIVNTNLGVTLHTNGTQVWFSADVMTADLTAATNGNYTVLHQEKIDATNGAYSSATAYALNATNGAYTSAKAYTDASTNSAFTSASTYALNATNALSGVLITRMDNATNQLYGTLKGSYTPTTTNGQVLATFTLGKFQRTNTANAITITSLTVASGSDSLSGVLVISNSAASSVLVTWPTEWINNLGFVSAYCTNAECMVISVNCLPGVMTNAAIVRTRKGASGVAP